MYVQRHIEARSCNHCCSGKAMSIAQPVFICSLGYPECNAYGPYSHLRLVQQYNIFLQRDFRKKKNPVIEH